MTRTVSLIAMAIALVSLVAACGGKESAPPDLASAESDIHSGQHCNGALSGSIPTNLIVDAGASCTVNGASIHGSVVVMPGALGFSGNAVEVSGHVEIHAPANQGLFGFDNSLIHGDVVVDHLPPNATFFLCGVTLHSVNDDYNQGVSVVGAGPFCTANVVRGFVYFNHNTGLASVSQSSVKEDVVIDNSNGYELVLGNNIDDNLFCNHNGTSNHVTTGANTVGGANTCG